MTLPPAADDHNCPAIAVDGLGYVHLFTNMHESTTLQYLTSTTAGSITSWAQGALPGLPSGYRLTYPHFTRMLDGTLVLIMRSVGYHDNGSYQWWTRRPA